MLRIPSEVDPQGSPLFGRSERRQRLNRQKLARKKKARLVESTLEWLEVRSLLATIPTPIVANQTVINGLNSNASRFNAFAPKVAVNPINPLELVAVSSFRNANPTTPVFGIQAFRSTDGGSTWTNVTTFGNQFEYQNPGATPPSPIPTYTRVSFASVAFDRNGNYYIASVQSNDAGSDGAVYLAQYAAGSTTPALPAASSLLYGWNQSALPTGTDASQFPGILDATIAVDINPANYVDPTTGAVQTDSFANSVYLAYTVDRPVPAGFTGTWNRYVINAANLQSALATTPLTRLDLGATGASVVQLSGGHAFNTSSYSTPQVTISNQFQLPTGGTVAGGRITVAWNDFTGGNNASPPVDIMQSRSITPSATGLTALGFSATTIGTTTIRGAVSTGNFPLSSGAAGLRGIGPGLAIASDNTLGSFSPYQGRIYLAYVDRYNATREPTLGNANEADNTDIFLKYSDDAGASWQDANTIFGVKVPVNQDDATVDGTTGAADAENVFNGTALHASGRPQFDPRIAVDQTTGTVVVTYYDARDDASRNRVRTTIGTSIDGGITFGKDGYVNQPQVATDSITGQNVVIGPIPDNMSGGNSNSNLFSDVGVSQGLAVANGVAYPVWTGNMNGQTLSDFYINSILTARVNFAAGPRIIASTMGPVKAMLDGGNQYNNQFASDGTQMFDGFTVTFDRAIDPATFTASTVTVRYNSANGGAAVNVPVASVSAINNNVANGDVKWFVRLQTPQSGIGTYSYSIAPTIKDRMRQTGTLQFVPSGFTTTQAASGANINLPIPAGAPAATNGTTTSNLTVSGAPVGELVTSVTVNVNIAHTFDNDLRITLVSPAGTQVVLANRVGANGQNFTNTTFDDLGLTSINAGVAPFNGTFIPAQALSRVQGQTANGNWRLVIQDLIGRDVGTLLGWSLTIKTGTRAVGPNISGNLMDQTIDIVNGVIGQTNRDNKAGLANDAYSNPTSLNGVPFNAPYDTLSTPIIVGGPRIADTTVPNAAASIDNLALNSTVKAIDVTFDRTMNPSTFTRSDVLRIVGPLGRVDGPTTYLAGPGYQSLGLGQQIPDNKPASPLVSSISIPSTAGTFIIDNLAVQLSITHPRDSDLTAVLVAPDGTRVTLFSNVGGTGANFTNTVFDDQSTLLLSSGAAPFTNTYKPVYTTGATTLSNLIGKVIEGVWKLELSDSRNQNVGSLVSWSLIATPKITVSPVAVYNYPSSDVVKAIPVDKTPTTTTSVLSIPVNTAGSGGVPITLADLKFKAEVDFATLASLSLSLVGPDGTTVPIAVNGPNIYASTSAFNGKALAGNWQLRIVNNTTNIANPTSGFLKSWSLTATATSAFGTPTQPESFRITFPQQAINGTYNIQLSSDIASAAGDKIDNNINAGVDLLRGTPTPGGTTLPVVFNSQAVPVTISAGKSVSSTIVISDAFPIQSAILSLNIQHTKDPDLQATLTTPYGDVILFSNVGNIGAPGTQQNFTNTVFDDNATTPIQNGAAPFTGRFTPQTSLLSRLFGKGSAGTYTLTITSSGATDVGTLLSWSLTLGKAQPGSGLGESVADQSQASFRIFNLNPTDPISTSTWVEVGPQGINNGGTAPIGEGGADDRSSRIGGLAMDPSDPSGNTFYAAGASGGVFKTTNFLTNDPKGPTWVALTDLGPNNSLNVGSIAVYGRNGDTSKSIVFVATGEGDTSTPGVGVLRSMDGGLTWDVLTGGVNADASGNILPITSNQRTNEFVGLTSFKVVVDPRPTPAGETIVYLAVSGDPAKAGLWRSLNTGKTWTRLRAGQATDVVLDPSSGTIDAISNPTGNLRIVYSAFRGEGVFFSPNQGQSINLMAGGLGNSLIVDSQVAPPPPVPVAAPAGTPNGAKGRIVIAKPALTGIAAQDAQYAGWLYAAVATPNDQLDGLYQTKDFGRNWVRVRLNNAQGGANNASPIVPTNDPNGVGGQYDPTGGNGFSQANYDISLVVDPINPNVVYLGGSANGIPSGLIRVDSTLIQDSHAFFVAQNNADGGQRFAFGNGGVTQKTPNSPQASFIIPPYNALQTPFTNFIRDPFSPFLSNATILTIDAAQFSNTGLGATYIPWDGALGGSTDQHEVFAFIDPTTGKSRIVFGDDQGIYTGIDRGDGTFVRTLGGTDLTDPTTGTVLVPTGSRNGNLQINQIYYGASQPTTGLNAQLNALFYFTTQDNGFPQSDPNLLATGNLRYSGPGGDGTGVATDQTGSGTSYHYRWPCCGGNFTDFFTVDGIGRTFGLVQTNRAAEWPNTGGVNFAVNPINGDQIVIGSILGNLYGTENQGRTWFQIGSPANLDGTLPGALAYGAPDPTNPNFTGALNNFIYAGTAGGRIFVTFTGGGGAGNNWINISAGLDGSPIQTIVTNPNRGSGEAYAVTLRGVYYMKDSRIGGASWQNITGNLFSISHNPYDNVNLQEQLPRSITSLQVDYRYAIPDDATNPNSALHPVLYIGGTAGVYRSFDKGTTWSLFPDIDNNGSIRAGGYLPTVQVTDLDLVTGIVNPTTGHADGLNAPNLLLASTYGRGAFAIRLAPIVFEPLLTVAPANGTGSSGFPNVTTKNPTISGFSQQTAFGNTTNIKLVDLSNLSPLELTDNAIIANAIATKVIGTGKTDAFGAFSVNVTGTGFQFNGVKRIGAIAVDGSGTQGNLAIITFELNDATLGPALPPSSVPPTAPINLALLPADDSGVPGDLITNVIRPRITGKTDPNILVQIVDNTNAILAQVAADANGNFTIRVPSDLQPDGPFTILLRAVNSTGPGPVASITITIDSTPNTPTLALVAADDSGIAGDLITNIRTPRFTGITTAGATVELLNSTGTIVLASTTADLNTGSFTIQVPTPLTPDGTYSFQARARIGSKFSKTPNPVASVTIDTSAPGPVTLAINTADLVGLKLPGITNLRRPRFVGTTEPNAVVKILRPTGNGGFDTLNIVTASSNGSFTFQLPFELSNGIGTLQALATDSTGNSQTSPGAPFNFRVVTVEGDYFGTGLGDIANFRPTTGEFITINGTTGLGLTTSIPANNQFTVQPGRDIPIAADFDSDGRVDYGVFRRDTAEWLIQRTTLGPMKFQFGQPGNDEPIPADYDGDGRVDWATFRPNTSQWFIAQTTAGPREIQFGQGGLDRPVIGDFNGDGRSDFAAFRPTTDQFFIYTIKIPGVQAIDLAYIVDLRGISGFTYAAGDIPISGDFDGIGKSEVGVYRPSNGTFFVMNPITNTVRAIKPAITSQPNDVPVPLDYDGDGKTDAAVFRSINATWFIQNSATNTLKTQQYGQGANDIAIPGRYSYRMTALRAPYAPTGGFSGTAVGGAFYGASQGAQGTTLTNGTLPIVPGIVSTTVGNSTSNSNGTKKTAKVKNRTVKVKVNHNQNAGNLAKANKNAAKHDQTDNALASALNSLGKIHAGRFHS